MQRVSWVQSGSVYHRVEGDISNPDILSDGIYEVGLDLSGWHLIRTADTFTFDYKVYHLQREFIDHIKYTYNNTHGNLGVLFNGTRGTGKTVTAKILANELNLPIILVKSMGDKNPGLISYLSSFNFDCVFFFDEFEKQFSEGDCSILQIMDGVYNSPHRKIFLLTTNDLSINPNLMSRPSRIRYVREFGNLEPEIVNEFLEDALNDKSAKEDLIDYIDTLTISTIDILKAIVEEVNIHGIDNFLKFKNSFNVESARFTYHTIEGSIDEGELNDCNYTIEEFVKEAFVFKNRFELEQKFKATMEAAKTDEEKEEIKDKYYDQMRRRAYFEYHSIYNEDKAWNKLRKGKDEFDDGIVVGLDAEKKVVVTKCGTTYYFYWIQNPAAKPSLYKGSEDLRYIL